MKEELKNIPVKDTLVLTPLEKYKIYGRFPYKLFVHIMLIISTTIQTIMLVSDIASYTRAQEKFIYNTFLNDNDKTDLNFRRHSYLFYIDDVISHASSSIDKFFSLQIDSMESVEYIGNKKYVLGECSFKDNNIIGQNITENFSFNMIYNLTDSYKGPFELSRSQFRYFINKIDNFILTHEFLTFIPYYYDNNYECFHWKVKQIYDFSEKVHIRLNLNIARSNCIDKSGSSSFFFNFFYKLVWIHLIIFILSIISMILAIKSYWRIFLISKKINDKQNKAKIKENKKIKNDKRYSNENDKNSPLITSKKNKNEDLDNFLREKKKNNYWILIIIVGNITQFFGSGLCLMDSDYIYYVEYFVGIGCFFAYINLIKYISKYRDYASSYHTLNAALPTIIKFIFSSLVLFGAFLFFAYCLFWRSERFSSVSMSMISLFCLFNGDSILDIIKNLLGANYLFSGLVFYILYCLIFFSVGANIFIAIIEDTYVSIKARNKNHWIYNHLNQENTQKKPFAEEIIIEEDHTEKRKEIEIMWNKRVGKVETELNKYLLISNEFHNLKSTTKQYLTKFFLPKLRKLEESLIEIKLSIQKKE